MTDIRIRIRVGPDHRVSGTAPAEVPTGEHEAVVSVATRRSTAKRLRVTDLPTHNVPWDSSIPLRREQMYGDDGR